MTVLSLAMLVIALLFLWFVVRNINKNKILFDQAFMWLLIGIVLIVISIFDTIPQHIAALLGFSLTSNFLLLFAVLFLLALNFLFSLQLSKQKEETKTLIQEVSLLKQQLEKLEKDSNNYD